MIEQETMDGYMLNEKGNTMAIKKVGYHYH